MIQYLILHKVRGEPTWDAAHQIEAGDEKIWIVTSSGHRAYPVRWWDIEDLADISDINNHGYHSKPSDYEAIPVEWAELPDHYDVLPQAQKKDVGQLLKLLGAKTATVETYNGVKMRRL